MTVTGVNVNKVPPDGGYGWVVVFSHALNLMLVLPLFFGFALVFKEAMSDVGLSHSQGSLVLVLNSSIGMFVSFLGGPFLRRFGYRKVVVTGAILSSLGLFITAIVSSFWMFILSYSVMNSIGVGAILSGSMVAINSFFKEKKGRAMGVSMSLMGLGTILLPLLINVLLTSFGWRYTILTLSAISLNSLVAACLLRPVKWYLKYPPHSEEIMPLNENTKVELINARVVSSTNGYGLQSKENANLSTKCAASPQDRNITSIPDVSKKHPKTLTSEGQNLWWASQEITLGSSINIQFKEQERKLTDVENSVSVKDEQPKSLFRKFVDFFDLTLLTDPIFVNILFGSAMAACAENNIFIFLPIILQDMMQFENEEIARLMSIIGVTDTLFRLLTPFIGERCKLSPRVHYLTGLLQFVILNTTMLFMSSFMSMVFLALVIGAAKGYRAVYLNLLIPCYVPIERLACAWGLQMLINGTMGFCIGSMLGRLRETSGAYHVPIVVLNIIIMLTIISWVAEFLYFRIKNLKS